MSFDVLAPHYRWMEFILAGDKLQRCRLRWLDAVKDCRRVLVVGEGNGRFLSVAGGRLANAHFTVIDGSAAMLERARERWRKAGYTMDRVEFVQATLPDALKVTGPFDLVVTHFFLDCFTPDELQRIVGQLARVASSEAFWLLADFQVPAQGWAHWRARWILRTAYTFFRFTTGLSASHVVAPDDTLQHAGFDLKERYTTDWGLLHSDLWRRRTTSCF